MLIFTKAGKGKTKACYGGCSYNYEKDSKLNVGLTFWQCKEYWMENKVRSRMHVCDGNAAKFMEGHKYVPNGQRKQVLRFMHKLI